LDSPAMRRSTPYSQQEKSPDLAKAGYRWERGRLATHETRIEHG
jgi:hypothetical protein